MLKHIKRRIRNYYTISALLLSTPILLTSCALQSQGQGDAAALPAVEQSAAIDSSCAYFYFLWGNHAEYSQRYDEALEAYEKASICDPSAEYIAEKIPILLIQLNRLEDARRWLERYVKDKPHKSIQRFMLARIKLQEGKVEEAIRLYQGGLDLDPDNANIKIRLGLLYSKQEQYDRAEETLQGVLQQNPSSYFASLYLARMYQKSGKLKRAEQYYLQTMQLNWSKELAHEIAEFYNLSTQFDKASVMYKKILEEDSEDEQAALGLVQTYLFLQDTDSALKELNRIRGFATNLDHIDLVRSQILINEKELDQAKAILQEVVERTDLAEAHFLLGVVYYESQEQDKAIDELQLIGAGADEYTDSIILQVRIYQEQDTPELSIDLLNQALADETSRKPKFFLLLSAVYQRLEKKDKALQTLAAGVDVYPDDESLLYEYGILLEKNGQQEKSMELMQKIIQINPNHADALNFIGYIWADKNIHLKEAYDMISRAFQLKPHSGYIQDSLGWVLYRMDKQEEALENLLQAVEKEPEDPFILDHLGDIYRALKKTKEAQYFYEEAIKFLENEDTIKNIQNKINEINN